MNKGDFVIVLQVALLHFDGVSIENLKQLLPDGLSFDPKLIIIGVKLSNYLKELEVVQ